MSDDLEFPLGRKVEHDPRSKDYRSALSDQPVQSVMHWHAGPPLDQGKRSSCVGNTVAQIANTAPFWKPFKKLLTEDDAVALYSRATVLDEFPGQYPPDDSGSSGLAGAKAGVEAGQFTAYRHAFGLDDCLAALSRQPVMIGIPWFRDMFHPDEYGFVTPTGTEVGGHEFTLLGVNTRGKYVVALNSWGVGWGLRGFFRIKFDALTSLLAQQGDVTVPVP